MAMPNQTNFQPQVPGWSIIIDAKGVRHIVTSNSLGRCQKSWPTAQESLLGILARICKTTKLRKQVLTNYGSLKKYCLQTIQISFNLEQIVFSKLIDFLLLPIHGIHLQNGLGIFGTSSRSPSPDSVLPLALRWSMQCGENGLMGFSRISEVGEGQDF